VVIGGTSLFGGRGSVVGTVYGTLFVTLLDNGLKLMGLSSPTVLMAKGTVILAAALVDAARERLERAR
jgi:ribose/xylose/arabinose/galactoside ABC-type transport system permease subunit